MKITQTFDKDKLFFTSDLHFGHANIITFCSRPFRDVDDMENALITRWNDKVPEDGVVFILGDFCWTGTANWKRILPKLNGTKYLILGNHDYEYYNKAKKTFEELFAGIYDVADIVVDNQCIQLCHYPLLSYNHKEHGGWQLYGHVHSGPYCTTKDEPLLKHLTARQYDVGVDNNDYKPVSYEQVKRIIDNKVDLERINSYINNFHYGEEG